MRWRYTVNNGMPIDAACGAVLPIGELIMLTITKS